jgi:hypothetical protein
VGTGWRQEKAAKSASADMRWTAPFSCKTGHCPISGGTRFQAGAECVAQIVFERNGRRFASENASKNEDSGSPQ